MTDSSSFFDFDSDDNNGEQSEEHEGKKRVHSVRDESGLVSTAPPAEKAILVGVDLAIAPQLLVLEDSLTELALLADTAGVSVVGQVTQRLDTPHPATLIGRGKVEELEIIGARAPSQCCHLR